MVETTGHNPDIAGMGADKRIATRDEHIKEDSDKSIEDVNRIINYVIDLINNQRTTHQINIRLLMIYILTSHTDYSHLFFTEDHYKQFMDRFYPT